MEKTTLYLPTELQRSLRETARRTGRSQADIVRDAVARYLAEAEPPRPRSFARPRSFGSGRSDGTVTGETSGSWLRREWDEKWGVD